MRTATRLFASVKSGRFLEPGNPTGLTGLVTHPTPRSTLIAIYGATLDRLKQIPEHSVYRQSVEAITRHRLNAIESVKPKGYDEWVRRAEEKVKNNPDAFRSFGPNVSVHTVNAAMVANTYSEEEDEREVEWDGGGGGWWVKVRGGEVGSRLVLNRCVCPGVGGGGPGSW